MKLHAYAKLNLTLNVYRGDGKFHELDSIVTSVDVFDTVIVTPRADDIVTVTGVDGVLPQDNTAWKTAKAFVDGVGTHGVDIVVQKGIPFGAGMGGSSADASAVAFAIKRLYGVGDDLVYDVCNSVGSDVWYMLHGGYARMTGKGQHVCGFCAQKPLYYVVTTFAEPCCTKDVFAAFDNLPEQPHADNDKIVDLLQCGKTTDATKLFCNNLQLAAQSLSSCADRFIVVCDTLGVVPTMTGSGSAYFVAFDRLAEANSISQSLRKHGFKARVCNDVPCGVEIVD